MDGVKNKLVVYTALFGSYDDLIDPPQKYRDCDFICFTDQKHLTSNIWEIRLVENYDLPPNIINRKYKILPHMFLKEYKWSLYVDANIAIISNPYDLAVKYLNRFDFVLPKHFKRDCIYEEAKECIILGKTKYIETINQINTYKKAGFPKNYGLGENNILLRNHNNLKVINIMNDWWKELNSFTNRDQLSLAYVLWRNGEIFHFMDENSRNSNDYFLYNMHSGFAERNFINRCKDSFYIRIRRCFIPILMHI